MEFNFRQDFESYKSINQAFDIPEFKDFNVITGLNGSGKTHFLQAIESGDILVEHIVEHIAKDYIKFFDYRTFKLDNEEKISRDFVLQAKDEILNTFNDIGILSNSDYKQEFDNIRKNNNITYLFQVLDYMNNLSEEAINQLREKRSQDRWININLINDIYNKHNIFNWINDFNSQLINNHRTGILQQYFSYFDENNYHKLSKADIEDAIAGYKQPNFLQEGFGKIFKVVSDEIGIIVNKKNLKPTDAEKEFESLRFKTPWNFVNEIFNSYSNDNFKYNYKVEKPQELANEDLKVHIINTLTNEEVEFDNLSSGEKVLLTLTLFLYQSTINENFPKVLLLDEIDAVLHPSMCERLIYTLKNKIIKNTECKIILATHNPSTIAFCDEKEDGIFIKNPSYKNDGIIEKQNKEKAIEILSSGLITLEKGLTLFDKVLDTDKDLLILTEGNNTEYIKKAIELLSPDLFGKIKIDDNLKDMTGKHQLKTLFQFFQKIPHQKKILFVWDCDVKEYEKLEEKNNTYPFIFEKNEQNNIAKKGIENLFDREHFQNFCKTIQHASGEETKEFDEKEKNNFLQYIINNGQEEDFENFEPLITKIKNILAKN